MMFKNEIKIHECYVIAHFTFKRCVCLREFKMSRFCKTTESCLLPGMKNGDYTVGWRNRIVPNNLVKQNRGVGEFDGDEGSSCFC
jgi:hypothetical protein